MEVISMSELIREETKSGTMLKKHVGAIHSSGALSLLQRKIANSLLFNAYDELTKKDEHTISIKHLCFLIGYNSNDYKTVKIALIKLLSTVIEWNLIDTNTEGNQITWNASSIISDASITGSICTYSFSNRMRELLHTPEMYGQINMAIQAEFQSSYGLALYENCIRYKNLHTTPWIDFNLFRKLIGVQDHKYTIFRDFKRRALDKAVQEINQVSDINVEAEIIKQSGKPSSIRFKLKKKKIEGRAVELVSQRKQDDSLPPLLCELMMDFAMKKKQAEELLTTYDEVRVKEKVEYIKSLASYKKNTIKNLPGYLVEALKHDFQNISAIKSNSNAVNKEQVVKKKNITTDYVISKFQNLPNKKKLHIQDKFSQFIEDSKQRQYYMNHGICNSILAEEFRNFIINFSPEILHSV